MTRFANHFVAAVIAIMVTATTFAAVTSTPLDPQLAANATTLLA